MLIPFFKFYATIPEPRISPLPHFPILIDLPHIFTTVQPFIGSHNSISLLFIQVDSEVYTQFKLKVLINNPHVLGVLKYLERVKRQSCFILWFTPHLLLHSQILTAS